MHNLQAASGAVLAALGDAIASLGKPPGACQSRSVRFMQRLGGSPLSVVSDRGCPYALTTLFIPRCFPVVSSDVSDLNHSHCLSTHPGMFLLPCSHMLDRTEEVDQRSGEANHRASHLTRRNPHLYVSWVDSAHSTIGHFDIDRFTTL